MLSTTPLGDLKNNGHSADSALTFGSKHKICQACHMRDMIGHASFSLGFLTLLKMIFGTVGDLGGAGAETSPQLGQAVCCSTPEAPQKTHLIRATLYRN